MPSSIFTKYQLKPEFKALFTNLATSGSPLAPRDALREPGSAARKSYSEEEVRAGVHDHDTAVLKRLVAAGFVEESGEGVSWVERGEGSGS